MTPYQKRLKEVQEEMARLITDQMNQADGKGGYDSLPPHIKLQALDRMKALAIRQIQREAEAIRTAHTASEVKSPLGWSDTELEQYLKEHGYIENKEG